MSWRERIIADAVEDAAGRSVIILDPEDLLDGTTAPDGSNPAVLTSWLELRRWWDHRQCDPVTEPVLAVVHSPEFVSSVDLPWDIENACTVTLARAPVTVPLLPVLQTATPELEEAVILLARQSATPEQLVCSVLREHLGVVLPVTDEGMELDAVIRIHQQHAIPSKWWAWVTSAVQGQLARPLSDADPDWGPLQRAWRDWMAVGNASQHAACLNGAKTGLLALLAAGVLRSEPLLANGLPSWVSAGSGGSDPLGAIHAQIESTPEPFPPVTADDWIAHAIWWGELRALAAEAAPLPPELEQALDSEWERLDAEFRTWVTGDSYGLLFSSSRDYPPTLDRIGAFLHRRILERGRRQLLVVMDGMGFAQWSQLRRVVGIGVAEGTGTFAMCPTLTPISRQAIFAGTPPWGFNDHMTDTSQEERLWRSFWDEHGVGAGDVAYHRIAGGSADQLPGFGSERVVGLVVLAIDEILHGAEVFGDAQVAAAVGGWARQGVLERIISQGDAAGFDVWLTSDHGNIDARPSGRVMEGLRVESAGTRVRMYANDVLRAAARADGLAWDPPGVAPGSLSPLFATGRLGFHSSGIRVTHGGLSLDEVIVPFVRVVP